MSLPVPPPVPQPAFSSAQASRPHAVIVLAAGSGSRVGAVVDGVAVNKVLLPMRGVPVIVHSVRNALASPGLTHLVVVARAGEEEALASALVPHLGDAEVRLVVGGASRHASEWAGIRALASEIDAGEIEVVAVHDGARPLAAPTLYADVVEAAAQVGGAVPVVPTRSVITLDHSVIDAPMAGVQTPQAFRAGDLLEAYRRAEADGFEGTDTASCLEKYSDTVRIAAVASGAANLKITFAEDVALAEALLARQGD